MLRIFYHPQFTQDYDQVLAQAPHALARYRYHCFVVPRDHHGQAVVVGDCLEVVSSMRHSFDTLATSAAPAMIKISTRITGQLKLLNPMRQEVPLHHRRARWPGKRLVDAAAAQESAVLVSHPPRIASLSPGGRNMAPSAIRSRKRPGEKGHRCEGVVLCPGQVPALIAKFESTGTPVPLQCHPEVVWPDDHAELLG